MKAAAERELKALRNVEAAAEKVKKIMAAAAEKENRKESEVAAAASALPSEAQSALRDVRERVARDSLPLLSLPLATRWGAHPWRTLMLRTSDATPQTVSTSSQHIQRVRRRTHQPAFAASPSLRSRWLAAAQQPCM